MQTKIDLRHYKKEWRIINKRIVELRKLTTQIKPPRLKQNEVIHRYINSKIESLLTDYKECPECVLESLSDKGKEIIRHHIQPASYKILKQISKKSKAPITTIIDRLIITPLLIEK
jgi:hemerythrin